MTLQLLHSEFSYILYEKNLISFFISALIGPILSKLVVKQIQLTLSGINHFSSVPQVNDHMYCAP
jgi:hypothetical protein